MINYTCGFYIVRGYVKGGDSVLLVCKTRPDWQVGLWNGVGGKVEANESFRDGMAREFKEETGIDVPVTKWDRFAREIGNGYDVTFFRTYVDQLPPCKWMNDVGEKLSLIRIDELRCTPVVGNLRWLIPMALDWRSLSAVIDAQANDIKFQPTW